MPSAKTIILILATQVLAIQGLSLLQHPASLSVSEGSVAILECVFNGPAQACAWSKDGEITLVQEPYNYIGSPEIGNCSIRINAVNLARDDGLWKCQYPRLGNNPAVTSNEAKLTVLVPPSEPVLIFDGKEVETGERLSVQNHTDNVTVVCVSRQGNPPAELYWMIDNERRDGINRNESTLTEQSTRLFDAESQLQINIGAALTETQIKCVAEHLTYNGRLHETYGYIQIHHNTTEVVASVSGSYKTNVDAIRDEKITLYCIANGVPSPSYTWAFQAKGADTWQDLGNQQNLTVTAADGSFICRARNQYNIDPVPSVDHITVQVKEREVSDGNNGALMESLSFVVLVLAATINLIFIN